MTAISILGGLVVMKLARIVRAWGSIPYWGTEFFQIVSLIWYSVTLVVVSISAFHTGDRGSIPWQGAKCDNDQCPWLSNGYDTKVWSPFDVQNFFGSCYTVTLTFFLRYVSKSSFIFSHILLRQASTSRYIKYNRRLKPIQNKRGKIWFHNIPL